MMLKEKVVRRIRRREKDLSYILRLREDWRMHRNRFPYIVDGLTGQGESIISDIADLRDLKVRLAHIDGKVAPTMGVSGYTMESQDDLIEADREALCC